MNQKNLFVELEYCTGCRSCEVACKQENNLPVGIKWINVVQVGPRKVGNKLKMDFVPMRCRNCAHPPCMEACPEDAIFKRSDGIVMIDPDLCIGCASCLESCPFGAIQINPETDVAQMCTLCTHRIDEGLDPACVHHCPADCIHFGNINDLVTIAQHNQAKRMVEME